MWGCETTDIFWYLLDPSLVITQGEMRHTHTMFMKFQTSPQSFDQILRYGPVVTDATLPVPKKAQNHVHVWKLTLFCFFLLQGSTLSKSLTLPHGFPSFLVSWGFWLVFLSFSFPVCLFASFLIHFHILAVDAWFYSCKVSFHSRPRLTWYFENVKLNTFMLGNIFKEFQMFCEKLFANIHHK